MFSVGHTGSCKIIAVLFYFFCLFLEGLLEVEVINQEGRQGDKKEHLLSLSVLTLRAILASFKVDLHIVTKNFT